MHYHTWRNSITNADPRKGEAVEVEGREAGVAEPSVKAGWRQSSKRGAGVRRWLVVVVRRNLARMPRSH
jgi:hypothetical protein